MSADNWTYCPKCQTDTRTKRQKAVAEVKALYGQLDAEVYNLRLTEAENISGDTGVEPTLREDFNQGMFSEGRYEVDYHCRCTACGWKWSYTHRENAL